MTFLKESTASWRVHVITVNDYLAKYQGEMMKKASDLYSLTRRELILLEMFNMLDDEEQVQRLCSLSGYLLGRKILSEDDSMKYLREIKKD